MLKEPLLTSIKEQFMNKSEFVAALAQRVDISKTLATSILEGIFAEDGVILTAMKAGDKVSLPGFGQFEVRNRAARTARNPATGATIAVPAKRHGVFKPLKGMKDAIV